MKKTVAMIISSFVLSTQAFASCGYVDIVQLITKKGATVKIISLESKGMLNAARITDTEFDLIDKQDNEACKPGKEAAAVLRAGTSNKNYCDLTIEDGPFMWEPEVRNIDCYGKTHYQGIDIEHSLLGNSTYKLKFVTR